MPSKTDRELQGVCGCPCHTDGVVASCQCYHGDFREFSEPEPQPRPRTYVYIAGPYGDKDPYCVIDARINEARKAARELAIRGVPYYSPHLNCAHFEAIAPEAPVEFWVAMGMGFVENAWGMWMLPGWLDSKGSLAEYKRALDLAVPAWVADEQAANIAAAWHGEHDHR